MRFNEFKTISLKVPTPTRQQRVSTVPIAEPIKRERLIQNLTAQITRQANVPMPTKDDIAIAVKRFKQNQKRANLSLRNARR